MVETKLLAPQNQNTRAPTGEIHSSGMRAFHSTLFDTNFTYKLFDREITKFFINDKQVRMAEWSKAPDSSSGLREKAWVQIPLLTLFSPFSLKFLLLAKTVRFEQKRCVSIDNRNGTFETNAAFRCRFTFIFLKQSLTALEPSGRNPKTEQTTLHSH